MYNLRLAARLALLGGGLLLIAGRADAQALAVPSQDPDAANAVAKQADVYDQSVSKKVGIITDVDAQDRVTMTLFPTNATGPASVPQTVVLPKSVFFVSSGKVSLAASPDQLRTLAQ